MSYTYILKKRIPQTLEEYVSGNMRLTFIKNPVVDKEQDSTPVIYEKIIENDPTSEEKKEVVHMFRSIGCQTLMRESEAQSYPTPLPADPKKIKVDGQFLEILELKDFSYGNGLPVETFDIDIIVKAREKRAFNDALPPLSDQASFILRNRFTTDQENREWNQKEKEIEEVNKKRLLTLCQYLENREKEYEQKRLEKIDKLKEKKDEEVEGQIIKSRKKRVKIIRNISKLKDKFSNNKGKRGRDIILDYASFGSKVYAPLTRDGHNPDRHPFKFELDSFSLSTFDGLSQIETEVSMSQSRSMRSIVKPKMEKEYSNSLGKLEKVHMKAIEDAFDSIKKQELKKIDEREKKERRREEKEKLRKERMKVPEPPPEKNLILEDVLLFQRLLRGRKEQILMKEGRKNRTELIKELKKADEWKKVSTDEEQKLIENYKEKLTNGVVDAIQGDNISKTLDYLAKERIRLNEEQKINAIVMMAEDQRRRRQAEEMGRRQAENILRDRQDNMIKELQEVNHGTMDSYINSLLTNTVSEVSKKQITKELEFKAKKLNKIVDAIEDKLAKEDVKVRDLVSNFLIPNVENKKKNDQIINFEEVIYIGKAKASLNTSLKNAQDEYAKPIEEEKENE